LHHDVHEVEKPIGRPHFQPLVWYHTTRCNSQKQNALDCASLRTKDQEHTLQRLHDVT
jgi:hypothetical protein